MKGARSNYPTDDFYTHTHHYEPVVVKTPNLSAAGLLYAWVTLRCLSNAASLASDMIAQMFPVLEPYRVPAAGILSKTVQPWLPAEVWQMSASGQV